MMKMKQTNRNLLRIYYLFLRCVCVFLLFQISFGKKQKKKKKNSLKNDVNTEKIYLHKNNKRE